MSISREDLIAQINLVTKLRFENGKLHRMRTVPDVLVRTDFGPRTPEQVEWFLENDVWEDDIVSYCGVDYCITHITLNGSEVGKIETKDEGELELVERTSVTLADLYRKGRARGVVSARTSY